MVASQSRLDLIAHNLANASTTGYKEDRLDFSEALERTLISGGTEIGSLGVGPVESQRFISGELGNIIETHNPLDVAISHVEGAFAVQTPQGVRYTRNGAFSLNADKEIVTQQGYPVLDERNTPIRITQEGKIVIDDLGVITVGDQEMGRFGIFHSNNFEKVGSSLMKADDTVVASVQIKSNSLEQSNVSPIEAMIDLIKVGRLYEMGQKIIQAEDESSSKLIEGLRS